MTRLGLPILALLACTSLSTELFAQANQTSPPVPLVTPSLNTTTLTCQINCDTQAMNCMNNCIPVGGLTVNSAGAVSSPVVNPSCNSTCSSQQLVCKQQC